jgi:hypothetical protein
MDAKKVRILRTDPRTKIGATFVKCILRFLIPADNPDFVEAYIDPCFIIEKSNIELDFSR